MSILSVALIGKQNEPLYFYCKDIETSENLHLQMIAHSALDVVEEKRKKALQAGSSMDMYFGLLFPIEDYRVYGMYSNNYNKLIVICDSSGPEFPNMRDVIISLSQSFTGAMQNPFQELGKPLRSKRLDAAVATITSRQNQFAKRGIL
jgi:hypothetical protein